MKRIIYLLFAVGVLLLSACTKDLDRTPRNGLTADRLYANEAGYRSSLAKIYGGLSLTGNNGPDGSGDLR
jgi:starch-binding outer membrane protein, SusD/RagB family